jgi:biopolymer transport protein ExbD
MRLRHDLAGAIPVKGDPAGLPASGAGIEICKTGSTPVALTFGLLYPKIYVPEAWDDWSDSFRRMVIGHEMAHLRSRDRLGQVLQAIVRAIYFFHPLVWILDRKMDGYREMMCDDAVTDEVPGRATEYSRCLVEIAEQVMHGPATLGSASAFLRHKNGLMNRVRYQLEVGRMRRISVRTRILVFAGLLLMVLPLSWYCGNAETMDAPASKEAAAKKAQASMEEVGLVLFSGGDVRLDGKAIPLDNLGQEFQARFPSDRDRVLIRLSCGADVPMEMVSQVHKILVDMDLLKVLYEDGPEEAMPLELPSEDLQKKLQMIADKHAMNVKIGMRGSVEIDGERFRISEIKPAVEKGLAADPYMVVSLSWMPAASYDDFLAVLAQAKAGGAKRIAVQIGS